METSIIPSKIKAASARVSSGKSLGVGVVNDCVEEAVSKIGVSAFSPSKLIEILQAGLPFQELQQLQTCLAIPAERLAPVLGFSKATFHRRKGDASRLPSAV